jgi:hypothetical protein
MAAGVRLLQGWGRVAAEVSLVACIIVLLFVGAFFVWIAIVLLACLAYQLSRRRRPGQELVD